MKKDKNEDKKKIKNGIFPTIKSSITSLIEDEDAWVPSNKILAIGTLILIMSNFIVGLASEVAYAAHSSHSSHKSHSSHVSGNYHRSHSNTHTNHASHTSHESHASHTSHSNSLSHSNSNYDVERPSTFDPSLNTIDVIGTPESLPSNLNSVVGDAVSVIANHILQTPQDTPHIQLNNEINEIPETPTATINERLKK